MQYFQQDGGEDGGESNEQSPRKFKLVNLDDGELNDEFLDLDNLEKLKIGELNDLASSGYSSTLSPSQKNGSLDGKKNEKQVQFDLPEQFDARHERILMLLAVKYERNWKLISKKMYNFFGSKFSPSFLKNRFQFIMMKQQELKYAKKFT